jgi:hypothetical protein
MTIQQIPLPASGYVFWSKPKNDMRPSPRGQCKASAQNQSRNIWMHAKQIRTLAGAAAETVLQTKKRPVEGRFLKEAGRGETEPEIVRLGSG